MNIDDYETMTERAVQAGYESGFSAGMIEGRKKGVEESAECADRVAVPSKRRDAVLGDMGTGMIIAATTIASAIRSLITTGDAEKGDNNG